MALFRRSQIHPLNDPTLHAIQFERGFWASLPNARDGWSVIIEAPPSGPSDEQRAFFRLLKEQLQEIREKATAFIKEQTGAPQSVNTLQVYAIEIGNDEDCSAERFAMELADANAETIHRVRFEGGEPKEYSCDD